MTEAYISLTDVHPYQRLLSYPDNNPTQQAQYLRQANLLSLGPQLYCQQGDLLVMERLSGQPLGRWLQHLSAEDAPELCSMLQRLLFRGFNSTQRGLTTVPCAVPPSMHLLTVSA